MYTNMYIIWLLTHSSLKGPQKMTFTNNEDQAHMQNTMSDKGLHCLQKDKGFSIFSRL